MPPIFTKQTILRQAVDLTPVRLSFFTETYFPSRPENFSTTPSITFDVVKGKQRVAPTVSVGKTAKELGRDSFKTKTIVPPTFGGKRSLTVESLESRIAGEHLIEGGMSPDERARVLFLKDVQEIKQAIKNRMQLMVRQVILTGAVTAIPMFDGDEFVSVDYGQNPAHNLTLLGVNRWNQVTSTPTADLCDARLTVKRNSGATSEVVFLGNAAWRALKNNPDFVENFNFFGDVNFGSLQPRIEPNKDLTFLGRLNEAGMDLYLSTEMVSDPLGGPDVPFIPDDMVVIMPAEIRESFSMEFGAITQLNENKSFQTFAGSEVPKMLIEEESDSIAIQIQSKALPVLKNPESVFIMKVI